MTDFDEDDFDIDELLDEIDTSGAKSKANKSAAGAPSSSADKKVTGAAGTAAGGSASNKSVRFSDNSGGSGGGGEDENDFISKLPRSSREPSASLRTMFFTDKQSQPSSQGQVATSGSGTNLAGKPPSGRSSGRASTAPGASTDWLGIQDGPGSRPSSPPPQTQARSRPQSSSSAGGGEQKSTGNSSEEEEALFNDIGLGSTRRRSAAPPQPPPTSNLQDPSHSTTAPQMNVKQPQQQRRSGLGDATSNSPMSSLGAAPPQLQQAPKSPFSGSYLSQLGMSPPQSLELNKPLLPPQSKFQPLPSSADVLGGSLAPSFPPAQMESKPAILPFPSFSLSAPLSSQEPPASTPPTITTKKKVLKKGGGGGDGSGIASTLQLPSHLINEDELKAMSSSLKTLYGNQLEMLEKSYQEQMKFLSEANRRKEELLKEEMKAMQGDYEERLERLKGEIREAESRHPQKSLLTGTDITSLEKMTEQLTAGLAILRETVDRTKAMEREGDFRGAGDHGGTNQQQLQEILRENRRSVEGMEGTLKGIDDSVSKRFSLMNDAWKSLIMQIRQNMSEVLEAARSTSNDARDKEEGQVQIELTRFEVKMERSMEELRKTILEGYQQKGEGNDKATPKILGRVEQTEKNLIAEMIKLERLQKRTKEAADGITLEPLIKILENDREEEQRRRERLSVHLKEMRRDMKRILLETESRQETQSKVQASTEMELKTISQSMRDLNSQLKFSLISGPGHPENLTNQFNSSMQQTQAEMEMKLLREERQALSDSMAQITVEKRKLSEEKVQLEKDKLDFQREKDMVKNLEVNLKTRMDETEEIQRKTESVRKEELQLSQGAQLKMKELENEKSHLRSKLLEAEQHLRHWEQKLRQEKVELNREREFMERLRDQLLCPGCMKHNDAAGVVHPPPPPYIPLESSMGHSPRMPTVNSSVIDEYFQSRLNLMNGPIQTGSGSLALGGGDPNDLFDLYYRRLFNNND